jgi:hypothetical protein
MLSRRPLGLDCRLFARQTSTFFAHRLPAQGYDQVVVIGRRVATEDARAEFGQQTSLTNSSGPTFGWTLYRLSSPSRT